MACCYCTDLRNDGEDGDLWVVSHSLPVLLVLLYQRTLLTMTVSGGHDVDKSLLVLGNANAYRCLPGCESDCGKGAPVDQQSDDAY